MGKVGRPRKLSDEDVSMLQEKFEKYISETDIPIIAEFAYKNNVLRDTLYDYPEFSTLLKQCIAKKEAQLETLGLTGKVNPTMAIFSLKQLGWSDKTQTELTGKDGGALEVTLTLDEKMKIINDIRNQ